MLPRLPHRYTSAVLEATLAPFKEPPQVSY